MKIIGGEKQILQYALCWPVLIEEGIQGSGIAIHVDDNGEQCINQLVKRGLIITEVTNTDVTCPDLYFSRCHNLRFTKSGIKYCRMLKKLDAL